jgi:phosphoribosylformylglycinamidine synthase
MTGRNVPVVDAASAMARYRAVNLAQSRGLIVSCHDLSDGGLAVALAETAFSGGCGIDADLRRVDALPGLSDWQLLFSESASRLLVTVHNEQRAAFEEIFAGQSCACIGRVTAIPELRLVSLAGTMLMVAANDDLKAAWQAPLKEM